MKIVIELDDDKIKEVSQDVNPVNSDAATRYGIDYVEINLVAHYDSHERITYVHRFLDPDNNPEKEYGQAKIVEQTSKSPE